MAKILYGVHGTGHGHAIRALTVARHYPQHKFLFVSHGDGAQLLRLNVPLLECPNPATPVRAHQVMALATLWKALRHLRNARHWFRVVKKAAEEFQPDVTITDYEYFTPRIARLFGIPSLSLDNQHAITQGRLSFPLRQSFSWAATSFAIRALFSQTDRYLISCFFQPPHRNRPHIQWVAPLLREEIPRMSPNPGHHVVAYQGYSTFPGFTETPALPQPSGSCLWTWRQAA